MEHPATPTSDSSSSHGKPDTGSAAFKEAVAKGYEAHDIGLRPIFMFLAGLAVTLVVVLFAIYAIMMAIAAHDRSTDAVKSPVAVKLPPVYAPLQPSLGFYDDHEKDHDVLDWQDMDAMRYKAQVALNSEGMTPAGRHYIPIDKAMDQVLPKLHTQPIAMAPETVTTYPPGSYEGLYNDPLSRPKPIDPALHPSDMNRLNNLGN